MLQGWPPLGTARLPLSLSSLPRCSLRERLEKHIQKKGPMSLHILFPLLTMLFLAFSSLPWIPPSRFKSHPLCEAGHAAEKAHSQESTDGKTELLKREVMHPGSHHWRGRARIPAQALLLCLTPLQAALKPLLSPSPPATLPTLIPTSGPFPTW